MKNPEDVFENWDDEYGQSARSLRLQLLAEQVLESVLQPPVRPLGQIALAN